MAAVGSGRLSAPSSSIVKRVTFSQPPAVSTSRTALNGSGKDREKEAKKKRRHLTKVKGLSKPLLKSASESVRGEAVVAAATVAPPAEVAENTGVQSVMSGDTATVTVPGNESTAEESTDEGRVCPDYFGVKSYLHNFYESVAIKNPDMYEELEGGDYRYLIRPKKPRCRALWWKVAVWSGVNLLAIGAVVILVGYLVPRHPVVVGYKDDLEVIDRNAMRFNYNLDACKLSGLIVFCIGGTVVAIALLFPSFLYQYCDEDWAVYAEPFKVGTSSDKDLPPQSPTEKKIPATEEVTRIQPMWGADETADLQDGPRDQRP